MEHQVQLQVVPRGQRYILGLCVELVLTAIVVGRYWLDSGAAWVFLVLLWAALITLSWTNARGPKSETNRIPGVTAAVAYLGAIGMLFASVSGAHLAFSIAICVLALQVAALGYLTLRTQRTRSRES
jgi:hypothetical protein